MDDLIQIRTKIIPKKLSEITFDLNDAYESDHEDLDFVLPGLVQGDVGILTSAGGVGKSYWALEASLCVASPLANASLLKLSIEKHGSVLILNAEDSALALKKRLKSIGQHLNKEARQETLSKIIVKPVLGLGMAMTNPEIVAEIIEIVQKNDVRLIFVDTISKLKGSELDENSNFDMSKYTLALQSIAIHGPSVVSLHHISKNMAMNGRQDEQQSVRGASSLVDDARWQAYMATMNKEEAKARKIDEKARKSYVKFGISKQNNDEPFEECFYRRDAGGVLLPAELVSKGAFE